MIPRSLLVASRGDIAICVMRAAAELGIRTVAIFAEDDTRALHTRKADDARALSGTGAAAYLDGDQILAIAKDAGCDAIHPGCGFLSENAAFARRCHERGFIFVGPRPEIFELFGDKAWARSLAERCGVPVLTEMARTRTRRIEVQVIGDRAGNLSHLWERECSIQREGQQLIDIAPSPGLSADLRDGLIAAAMRIAGQARYDNLGTFAFMVEAAADSNATYAFIGAKPHLPVDHAVTEAVTDVDLVKLQLELAAGKSFADLGLCRADVPKPRGFAIAVRIGLEAIGAGDGATPAGNALTVFEAPSGPGLRVDSSAYMGYIVKAGFDSPLARLIAHSPSADFADVVKRAYRALCEFKVEGVATNIGLQQSILSHPDFSAHRIDTRFVDERIAELTASANSAHRRLFFDGSAETTARRPAIDPLFEGHALAFMEHPEVDLGDTNTSAEIALDQIRPDLIEVHERHAIGLDAARPAMVERRRKTGQRTARENVEDLCDPGTFVEYGPMVIAAQRLRRTIDDLIRNTPADGLVAGLGLVNGDLFAPAKARSAIMAYDYSVLAGTQGHQNHLKMDRLIEVARQFRLPLILFTEGGGGRPGDTEGGRNSRTFYDFPRLSGLVPMVAINSGRCYAGNASLLGCCDVVIAAKNSNIGMGGPAMIEGGGLGIFRPEEVGPIEVQTANGAVDIAVADEAEAVQVAKKYLSYFQGAVSDWDCADQRLLRAIIPENRLRVYDVRAIIETLADSGSVLELRRDFGLTMLTALVRVEGRPFGVVANNPMHLAGAIDSGGADKGARFIKLCDAFDIPLLFLCDTPGIMVGPEIEKTALVRHSSRMFLTAANATVPFFTIVLRKAYGLGGIAMAAGSYDASVFTVAWPTGEFGPMGLEGAVKLGYRNELAAITDPAKRKKRFDEMVARMYQRGKALNAASHFGIDDVIDPADSRRWIISGLRTAPAPQPRTGKKHSYIDSW